MGMNMFFAFLVIISRFNAVRSYTNFKFDFCMSMIKHNEKNPSIRYISDFG